MKTIPNDRVSINEEQRLYVIPCGTGKNAGYSCLGFDVAEKRRRDYLQWLKMEPIHPVEVGTIAAYNAYATALELVRERCERTKERCPVELTPELIGFEGCRVEVTTPAGEKSRFWGGKSTGFVPIHLEIKTRASHGDPAAYVPAGSKIRVLERGR